MVAGGSWLAPAREWNERRLLRDLNDVYYLTTRLGAVPDVAALRQRLQRIESRLPERKRRTSMSLAELVAALQRALDRLDEAAVRNELAPVLPPDEIAGLLPRLRAGVTKAIENLAPPA